MFHYHPKLISIMTDQTPRAMIALLIVALVYFWIFIKYVPVTYLIVWLSFQILLAYARIKNSLILNKYIKTNETAKIKQQIIYFVVLNILQALLWTIASIFSIIYAPQPFELVTFVMVIGIITAGVLSMSAIFIGYLVFFFSMIIPQLFIMYYFGEHQHIALILFALIYMPAIVLLSKSTYNSFLDTIKSHEALEESVQELHKLSIIDVLTNVHNRRYFFEMANNHIAIIQRENKVVSLLMFDIDFFKKINDEHGHQTGDFILKSLAKEVKSMMRKSDLFARVGGEEFAILLHDTSYDDAKIIAEKIRKKIEETTFRYNQKEIRLTISIGVSVFDDTHTTIEALYKKADKQLYKAKEQGRNKVC